MLKTDKIYVAGHRGMVGSACVRALKAAGFENIVMRTHSELDLLDPAAVRSFYEAEKPDVAIIAAARVGGIGANSAANSQFLYENELIALNTVWSAAETGVKRLLFLGSTCIYPRMAPQPIPESALLTSELEKTNEGYALAKISGLKLCEFLRRERGLVYHSLMPTNLYGPGDNYDTEHGHVLPTMIRKFETARVNGNQKVTLWGSGSPLREFLHVDDLASACLFLLEMENLPGVHRVGSHEARRHPEEALRHAAHPQARLGAEDRPCRRPSPHRRRIPRRGCLRTSSRLIVAVSEGSSSWTLGEYAVSTRSDLRSTAAISDCLLIYPSGSRRIRRGRRCGRFPFALSSCGR